MKQSGKWILFFSLIVTCPCLYFLFVVSGFVPLVTIIEQLFIGPITLKIINLLHIIIYGAIFYFTAHIASNKLSIYKKKTQALVLSCIVFGLFSLGFLPIYGAAHGTIEWKNLYDHYQTFK